MFLFGKPLSWLRKIWRCGTGRRFPGAGRWDIGCLALALVIISGCGDRPGENTAALVNGEAITMEALTLTARSWGDASLSGLDRVRLQRRALDQLIDEALIIQAGRRQDLTVTEAELNQRIGEVKGDYPEGAFEEMLIREYIDFEAWREQLRRNMLVAKVTGVEMAARVRVDAQGFANFAATQPPAEPEPARVRIRHITTESRSDAEKARKMLKSGQPFEDVAAKFGSPAAGTTAAQVPWVYPDRLPAYLQKAIQGLMPGQLSEVVESEFGFSVLLIIDVQPSRLADPAEEVKRLQVLYLEKLWAEAYDRWIVELRSQAKIVVNPALNYHDAKSGRAMN